MSRGNKREPALTAALTEDFFFWAKNFKFFEKSTSKFPIKFGMDPINGIGWAVRCNYLSAVAFEVQLYNYIRSRKT